MKITELNKDNLRTILPQVEAALKNLGIEGLEFSVGHCGFNKAEASFKVTMIATAQTGEKMKMLAAAIGLKDIEANGHKLVDYRSRATKMPVIYQGPDGKQYKCTIERAYKIFGKADL